MLLKARQGKSNTDLNRNRKLLQHLLNKANSINKKPWNPSYTINYNQVQANNYRITTTQLYL